MAIPDNLGNIKQDLKDINQLASILETSFLDISKATAGFAKSQEDSKNAIGTSSSIARDLAKSAKELAGFGEENLKNQKDVVNLDRKRQNLISTQRRLEAKILELQGKRTNASRKEQKAIDKTVESLGVARDQTQELVKNFDDILDTSTKIEKSNPFKGLGDLVSEIPVLNKFFPEFEKASSTFRDNMADGNGFLKSSAKSAGQLAGFFNKLTVGLAVKGLQNFDERSTSLSRNLNVSREQADGLVKSANSAARGLRGVTGDQITKAQQSFSQALGTTATLSNEAAANFEIIQSRLGLSTEQASELTKFTTALGQNSKTQTEELIAQTQILNAQTDSSIKYQDVLKDIAGTNKAVLLSSKGNSQELAKAAFEAKRFGINLNQADNIAGSLLDFESSIASELEAELLTGKDLNLERARQAALDGDLATLTSEIAKNVGSAEEFSNMNRIQQEAIAKSVGMTREDLAASLVEQQALTKLGAKDKNDLKEKTRLRLQEINSITDVAKREEARARLIKDLGSEELVRQQENRNLQELQAEAAQKIVEAFDKLSPILSGVRTLFDAIANNANIVAGALGTIMGLSLLGKFRNLLKLFKGLKNAASGLKSFFGAGGKTAASTIKAGSSTAIKTGTKSSTKVAAKAGAKLGGKTLLKRIPILGSVVGLGFAVDRAIKGDYAGAAMEAGSAGLGLLDLVAPGLGTGLSLAADAGIAARDMKRAGTITPTAKSELPVKDFILKPLNEDTITMAGGTKLGGNVEELLKELISVVKQGGDVYMDSTKVGTAMAVGTYKVQ